jgi:hypothetical protein
MHSVYRIPIVSPTPPIPSPWNPRPRGAANQAAERRQNRSPWREPWVRRRQKTTEPRRGDKNPRAADLTREVIHTEIEPDHPEYRDTLSSTIPTPPPPPPPPHPYAPEGNWMRRLCRIPIAEPAGADQLGCVFKPRI